MDENSDTNKHSSSDKNQQHFLQSHVTNRASKSNSFMHPINDRPLQRTTHTEQSFLFGPVIGRLGNEIFQYVAQYIFAKKTGRLNALDPVSVLPLFFPNIKGVHREDLQALRKASQDTVFEVDAGIYSDQVLKVVTNTTGNVGICCYFQSWRYMDGYENEVRSLLTIHSHILDKVDDYIQQKAQQTLKTLQNTGSSAPSSVRDFTYIGVHVRKGDMSIDLLQTRGYANAPASYILKAMQYFRDNFKHPLFLVVSDNLSWCLENLKRDNQQDVVFVSHKPVRENLDFTTLVRCNHTVVTSGTFGWWAGWLSGGTVVYYGGFPKPGTEIGNRYNATDYYPPQWIPMT